MHYMMSSTDKLLHSQPRLLQPCLSVQISTNSHTNSSPFVTRSSKLKNIGYIRSARGPISPKTYRRMTSGDILYSISEFDCVICGERLLHRRLRRKVSRADVEMKSIRNQAQSDRYRVWSSSVQSKFCQSPRRKIARTRIMDGESS